MKTLNYLLILALVTSVSATTYTCNSCSDCQNKINSAQAGDLVQLSNDILNHSGACITWNRDGVIFDCQEHLIDGSSSGEGLYLNNSNGNTIRNCKIREFEYGIILVSSDSNRIIDSSVSSSIWHGIILDNSNTNTIANSSLDSNSYSGIYLWSSSSNTIANNTVSANGDGIYLDNSTSNLIANNNVSTNGMSGIYLSGSDANTVTRNTACNNSAMDIDNDGENSGDENTCDNAQGWNDPPTTGCTYSCSGAVECLGDANGDSVVDYDDLLIVAVAYNTEEDDEKYDSRADFNDDGKVDYDDLLVCAVHYGSACA